MFRSTIGAVRMFAFAAVGAAMLATSATAVAQDESPWKQGNYWQVTGIDVKDGSGLKYAQFLATNWVKNQEYAKAQGWISDYMVLANSYPREGEANLYLIIIFPTMVDADESDRRGRMMREFNKTTLAQMQAESGARAEIRTQTDQMLLRQLVLRK